MSNNLEFNWNYQIPEPKSIHANQIDWNHTILTKFNQIWANNRPNKLPVKMIVPNKFRSIIESLVFYNKETQMINDRYLIDFINEDINFIDINGTKLNILNINNMSNKSGKDENLVKDVIMEKQEKKEKDFTATTGKGGGLRFNKGKLRYDLVEPRAFRDFVQVLTDGAEKYFDRNWENGLSWTSVLASLKRHIAAIEMGEDRDPESGRLHIAHAACNVHFLNAFYYTFPQGDDRPKRFLKLPHIGLDVDGVLADFTGAWNSIYPEISAAPNSWYLDRKVAKRFEEMRANGKLDEFYLNIKPMIKPEDLPFEPHCYITSRPVSKEITEEWLDMHGFPAKKVISLDIRESKVNAAKEAGVEIFVDDSYENFVDLNNHGVFTYLYTAPWNTRYDIGHMRLNSLKDIPILK